MKYFGFFFLLKPGFGLEAETKAIPEAQTKKINKAVIIFKLVLITRQILVKQKTEMFV